MSMMRAKLLLIVAVTMVDSAPHRHHSKCPAWVKSLEELPGLLEEAEEADASPVVKELKERMKEYLANAPEDEYHGEDHAITFQLARRDMEELTVCERNSARCFRGETAFQAMMAPSPHHHHHLHHAAHAEHSEYSRFRDLELEEIDLERESWVVPFGQGLWRVDPKAEAPQAVTGVDLPPDVPRMDDTTQWGYNQTKPLGSGSYKHVYVGHLGTAAHKVAICKIPAPHNAGLFPENELNYLTFELRYQTLFHRTKVGGKPLCEHLTPNIYGLHEEHVGEKISTVFLIRELLDGSLDKERYNDKETEAVDTAIEMALMLKCLKNAHILHRDIKPSNYLYRKRPDGSRQVLLQDFGLAANACDDENNPCARRDVDNLHDQAGSGMFMPPELQGEVSKYKFDMYSQGVTFNELGISEVNEDMKALTKEMLAEKYEDRPTPDDLLKKLFAIRLKIAKRGDGVKNEDSKTDAATAEETSALQRVFQKLADFASSFEEEEFRKEYPDCKIDLDARKAAALRQSLEEQLILL